MMEGTTRSTTKDPRRSYDGTDLILYDEWLRPHEPVLRRRFERLKELKRQIEETEGLDKFSTSWKTMGFYEGYDDQGRKGLWFREWAPGAAQLSLIGDFNGWNRESHPMQWNYLTGMWSIFLPQEMPSVSSSGSSSGERLPIRHGSQVKISAVLYDETAQEMRQVDRVPAWSKCVHQHTFHGHFNVNGVFWNPEQKYQWKSPPPSRPKALFIYEAHVGMSSNEPKISTYREFRETVLPYIAELGYNAIQLMGIMEHSYYSSFGYQVTNFFAPASRFGTPDDLKELIDAAHQRGILVFLDTVHSHASPNSGDGLNRFDGTDSHYFHSGPRGYHSLWGSRLFDYSKWEVLRFLLSNLRFWVEEYRFDGFRFDGVTSMLYLHHGIFRTHWNYDSYFSSASTDQDAIAYLALANDMLHTMYPNIITIAEDVSGFAGLCRPVDEGGLGFDYRLSMGVPDLWIRLCSQVKDQDWSMGTIVWELTNRRYMERTIGYCESHDQSLQGDKTLAFRLMDKDMYWEMTVLRPLNLVMDRGIALHKMIRAITMALAGDGYLNFMGNEFGHPEWIDFPRDGNNHSFDKCRRRWDLAKDKNLRYKFLLEFDRALLALHSKHPWFTDPSQYIIVTDEERKVIAFERGGLVWVFNFHCTNSYPHLPIGVTKPGTYVMALDSDAAEFGGHARQAHGISYFTRPVVTHHSLPNTLQVYLPSRSMFVLERTSEVSVGAQDIAESLATNLTVK